MKLNRLLTAIVVMMLSSGAVYAQKVELDKNGKVFIDASGIANTTKPNLNPSDPDSNTLYRRFEVQTEDNSVAVNWTSAVSKCAAVSPPGKWRLPTQREMQLIWVLTSELVIDGSPYFTPFNKESYWCATKLSNAPYIHSAYMHGFHNGETVLTSSANTGGTNCLVRCIREVVPLP